MRVLVLGGGAREHALCWALEQSPSIDDLVCTPGNAGIGGTARLRDDMEPTDPSAMVALAQQERIDLVVIGPEAPLVAGVTDALAEAGLPVFGPTQAAARLEGSKAFAKEVMAAAGVPTARHWAGEDLSAAHAALEQFSPPYVVKADGLAAGKGVRVCPDRQTAEQALRAALVEGAYGAAGATVVIEEHLAGPEVSLFGLCDGERVLPLTVAQDYKRLADGDEGPNTGGMGAYSPVPAASDLQGLSDAVLTPVADELARRGTPYVGVLYAGLVLTADGPRVLEFNVRFGDPEAQAILPRLQGDLVELLSACSRGELAALDAPNWDARACVAVVLAAGGYPGAYETGHTIAGIDEAALEPDATVFHAGTAWEGGHLITAGGRVLTVAGVGETIADARTTAYAAAEHIHFDGRHLRTDIAAAPLETLG